MKKNIWILATLLFSIILVSCNKVDVDDSLSRYLGLSKEELVDIKGEGKEVYSDINEAESIFYKEEIFGVPDVDIHFLFENNKIEAIFLQFPNKTNIKTLSEEISKILGKPNLEEEDRIEWINKDNIYYKLESDDDTVGLYVMELKMNY